MRLRNRSAPSVEICAVLVSLTSHGIEYNYMSWAGMRFLLVGKGMICVLPSTEKPLELFLHRKCHLAT